MNIALNGMTLSETDDLAGILEFARAHDIDQMELWPHNCPSDDARIHRYAFRGVDIASTKLRLREYGVRVCSVAFGCGLDPDIARDQETIASELVRAVEVAVELEAGIVNHYCGHILLNKDHVDIDHLKRYWEPAVLYAEKKGVVLSLENEAHDATQTPMNMRAIIRAFDSPSFKTTFDPANYYSSGFESFPYAYEILRQDVAYCHTKGIRKYNTDFCKEKVCLGDEMTGKHVGNKIYHTSIRDGATNMCGLIDQMKSDLYAGYFTIEPHIHDRSLAMKCIIDDLAFLRSHLMKK